MLIDIVDLRLSAQRALLGNVFPELRSVSVDSKENLIQICFYIDGEISDDQKDLCECVVDEIIADFFLINVDEKDRLEFESPIIRLDYPNKPVLVGSNWVYSRYEKPIDSKESPV
jgi:hypothetical protein